MVCLFCIVLLALPSPLIKAHVNAISSCNFVDEDKIITSSFDCSVKLWVSCRGPLFKLVVHIIQLSVWLDLEDNYASQPGFIVRRTSC